MTEERTPTDRREEPTSAKLQPATADEPTATDSMRDALGPEIASDAVQASGAVVLGMPRRRFMYLVLAVVGIVVMQVAALFIVPPFACEPGVVPCVPAEDPQAQFSFPQDAILANFEMPAPHILYDLAPGPDRAIPTDLITFDPTISASLFTGWLVMLVIIVAAFLLSRRVDVVPGRRQNALEYVYESLANLATSLGGPAARRYVPIFLAFFIFILMSNWSGLLPFVGRTYELRAPTSDVNVTVGLALVAFAMFHIEGVRRLGFTGYFGKFFSLRPFRAGIAAGSIALFVGALEFLLEFVKPVTLSMRLFGNIYAGEIALGVISALTVFILPVAMFGLEVLLNFMQALIFSALALMFTIAAIESHHDDDHHEEEVHPATPEGNIQPMPNGSAAA